MPDDFDAPIEQATAAPGEKRDEEPIYHNGKRIGSFVRIDKPCPHCNGTGVVR